jgi:hypothetical protein
MTQATTDLVHQGGTVSVSRLQLKQSCDLFVHELALLTRPYHVRSSVSRDIYRLFVSAIEGSNPELTPANGPALKLLCDEFRFTKFGRQVQTFPNGWTSVVFGAETVHVLRDKLVQTCSKFSNCPSLLTQTYHVTSSIGVDIFRSFVKAIEALGPTNENVTNIGLPCDEFGHEQL